MTRIPQTLAVKLTAAGERIVFSGHPWIFSNSITKLNKEGLAGDICVIFSQKSNKVIGVGLYDPESPIRIKILQHGGGAQLNEAFFTQRIESAYANRMPLLDTDTTSFRLIYGESDGFPGLIADVYNQVLVIKLYSSIWLPYLDVIKKILNRVSECECVVLRLSRKLQQNSRLELKDGQILDGTLDSEVVTFNEYGVKFQANVIKGHKTGYFLDHRHNRRRVGELSNGKTVLDVFCYAGGFSVHALANGAKSVCSVDISKQALELCRSNAALNNEKGEHTTLAGDAFDILGDLIQQKKKFEIVVIDPPSFAKRQEEVKVALKKYTQLAELGAQLAGRNGFLILASCSSRVSRDDFLACNEKALKASGRKYQLVETSEHDIDHPIGFPEAAYLKTAYYRFS